jgi:cell shape-determining protein MreC
MSIIKTEFDNLLRDTSSKAILVTDNIAREEFRKKVAKQKNQFESIMKDLKELQNSVHDINTLKQEISEIKQMLLCLCKNKEE